MAAVSSGRPGLVRGFQPFRGRCHLSGNSCERGACAAFSEVVPRRLLPRLVNRSCMKLGCKQRKDVGKNHLCWSFPRLPGWWCIFLSSYIRRGCWVFSPERVHSLNQRFVRTVPGWQSGGFFPAPPHNRKNVIGLIQYQNLSIKKGEPQRRL
jgi:hypothetical protein